MSLTDKQHYQLRFTTVVRCNEIHFNIDSLFWNLIRLESIFLKTVQLLKLNYVEDYSGNKYMKPYLGLFTSFLLIVFLIHPRHLHIYWF